MGDLSGIDHLGKMGRCDKWNSRAEIDFPHSCGKMVVNSPSKLDNQHRQFAIPSHTSHIGAGQSILTSTLESQGNCLPSRRRSTYGIGHSSSSPSESRPGRFGVYGGRYVPETLMAALLELEHEYETAKADPAFQAELADLLHNYAGRPTPLYFAKRLTENLGGAKIYLKREDLLHTGAHKINNAIGQGLLAKRMGKQRIIAETGAGQHGVATATVCALLGMECVVYMGDVDMARQELNVIRMRLLGAEVRGVSSGSKTLKDAISEAMRDWVTNVRTTFYILGSALGAHPYPTMVRDFHRCISAR